LDELASGVSLRTVARFTHTVTRHRLSVSVLEGRLSGGPVGLEPRRMGETRGLSAPSLRALRLLRTDRCQEEDGERVGDLERDEIEAEKVGHS
jgi:hypothetical protein